VWDLTNKAKKIFALPERLEDPQALALSAAGDVLAVCAANQVQIIDLRSGNRTAQFRAPDALGFETARWTGRRAMDARLAQLLAHLPKSIAPELKPAKPKRAGRRPSPPTETPPYKTSCQRGEL
jgi:hypothetical protein